MKLDKKSFEKYFSGYFITDCVVRSRDIVYFVLEQENDNGPAVTCVVACADRPSMPPWSSAVLTGMRRMNAGVSQIPKAQFVGVNNVGQVYAVGSGERGVEFDLKGFDSRQLREANAAPDEYLIRGAIKKLRTIEGRLYGCGSGRTLIERNGKSDWYYHTDLPESKNFLDPVGFEDVDGFTSKDIYAVGGSGDVWHFIGKKWIQIPFPSNMDLRTVCCAPDGMVYVGAESGTVFKGRDNKWVMISRGALSLPFTDMVWHDGAVWCTNDYGLWTIKNDKVMPADVPSKISVCAGHLSVGDGVLLLAGMYGAAMHDGKKWHRIIDYNDI